MDWYVVDKDYIKYLIQFDSRVGYVEYGEKLKLHVGILLTVNSYHYYVPISSAKPKHQRMSNSLDFHKLQDADTGYLYAVLNLNNMIPVPDSCITQLKYNQIEQFRSFSNEKEKNDYIYLLQKEKAIIDSRQPIIQRKAEKLYAKCLRICFCQYKTKKNMFFLQKAPPVFPGDAPANNYSTFFSFTSMTLLLSPTKKISSIFQMISILPPP